MRGLDNQVLATYHDMSWLEAVLGTHGRSGEQLDVFQAVFGPEGPEEAPAPGSLEGRAQVQGRPAGGQAAAGRAPRGRDPVAARG